MIKKIVSCVLACSLIMCFVCSCNSEQGKQETKLQKFSESYIEYFDTVCTVVGYEERVEEFNTVCKKIEGQLSEYNKLYDIYKSYEGVNNIDLEANLKTEFSVTYAQDMKSILKDYPSMEEVQQYVDSQLGAINEQLASLTEVE